jgi:hypothetical protein
MKRVQRVLTAVALVVPGILLGWTLGVWLYLGALWVVGENATGGIHLGAGALGLVGAVLVPYWLRRALPTRFGGRRVGGRV